MSAVSSIERTSLTTQGIYGTVSQPTDTQNVEFTKTVASQYAECAKNNAALVKITKDAFNVREDK